MILHDYYYDYDIREAHFEFILPEDDEHVIRVLDLPYHDLEFYTSDILDEETLFYMTDSFVKDILDNYIKERGLPSETYF